MDGQTGERKGIMSAFHMQALDIVVEYIPALQPFTSCEIFTHLIKPTATMRHLSSHMSLF